jgi:hypothetical protein
MGTWLLTVNYVTSRLSTAVQSYMILVILEFIIPVALVYSMWVCESGGWGSSNICAILRVKIVVHTFN